MAACRARLQGDARSRARGTSNFLRDACNGDSDLRREVESLLDAHGAAGHFMEQPAIEGLDASVGVQFAEDVQAPTVRSLRVTIPR